MMRTAHFVSKYFSSFVLIHQEEKVIDVSGEDSTSSGTEGQEARCYVSCFHEINLEKSGWREGSVEECLRCKHGSVSSGPQHPQIKPCMATPSFFFKPRSEG